MGGNVSASRLEIVVGYARAKHAPVSDTAGSHCRARSTRRRAASHERAAARARAKLERRSGDNLTTNHRSSS